MRKGLKVAHFGKYCLANSPKEIFEGDERLSKLRLSVTINLTNIVLQHGDINKKPVTLDGHAEFSRTNSQGETKVTATRAHQKGQLHTQPAITHKQNTAITKETKTTMP